MLKTLNVKEMVEKEVMEFGNGSIVYTPKKWIGKKAIVILEEKPVDIAGEAIEALKPHLGSIEGIFLFGSHARGEETEGSDMDVLVIADRKIEPEKNSGFDFIVKTKKGLAEEMKYDPTLFLRQIVHEAKPIMNQAMLDELKQVQVDPDFGKAFDSILGAFKKTKESLEKSSGKEFLFTNAPVYSLILRLKGLFIMQCYKKNSKFSNRAFMELIKSHGFSEDMTMKFIEAYRDERDGHKTRIKIPALEASKLFESAKIEFLKTERLVKGAGN